MANLWSVFHVDKFSRILLCQKPTEMEAADYIRQQYAGHFEAGKDSAIVVNSDGHTVQTFNVKWGPMYEPVRKWPFKSKSDPSRKPYETILTTLDLITCNCPGWVQYTQAKKAKGPRCCSHIEQVIAQEGFDVERQGQYIALTNQKFKEAKLRLKKQAFFSTLIAAYEKAIAYMASLDPSDMLKAAPEVELAKFKVECFLQKLEEGGIDGTPEFNAAQAKLKSALRLA